MASRTVRSLSLLVLATVAVRYAIAQQDIPESISQLLTDPKYQPFIETFIRSAGVCLNDPAITSFNIAQCPGLEQLLSDVYNNASDPKVTCEASCVKQLTQLSTECTTALKNAFSSDTSGQIGPLAVEFFQACETTNGTTNSVSPSTPELSTTTPSPSPPPSPSSASQIGVFVVVFVMASLVVIF